MELSYQSNQQHSTDPQRRRMQTKTQSLTRILLLCGAIAGPLFIFTVLIQDYTRPGFDPRLDPLSLLSLGDWGWVQIVNFALAGVLNLLYAFGLWRQLHPGPAGTWGPILIGVYGLGLILVSIFTTDPANGFPPGVTAATHPSWHGAIHALGGLFVFVMLSAALAVFVRLFLAWRERWWAFYCLVSAVLLLLIFFTGFSNAAFMARTLRLATLIGWMAASLIALVSLFSAGLGVAIGAALRRVQVVIAVAINVAIYLFFLSGGIGVLAFEPTWLQNIAAFVPLTYGRHALEQAVFYSASDRFVRDMAVLALSALVAIGLGIFSMRRGIIS